MLNPETAETARHVDSLLQDLVGAEREKECLERVLRRVENNINLVKLFAQGAQVPWRTKV